MKFHVMDHTGDTETEYKTDAAGLTEAERLFSELVKGRKYTAHAPGPNGAPGTQLKKFDPNVEVTIFTPPLQGG